MNLPLPVPQLDYPPPGTALVEELDKKLLVQLRDGKKIIGVLRSFDQFANLILEEAFERIIVGQYYTDVPLGMYLIRGENLVLMGQIDPDKEVPHGLTCVSKDEIDQAKRAEKEEARLKGTMRARMDFLDE
jgi:U6 snRNA-associated Sm-like protein LSm1